MHDQWLSDHGQPARRNHASGFFSYYKVGILALWITLIGGYALYLWRTDVSVVETLTDVSELLHSPWGPLLYLFLFVLRSILFFSAGILSIAGGIIFGSGEQGNWALAFLYVLLGTVSSALASYALARYFGGDLVQRFTNRSEDTRKWTSYMEHLRQNGFMTVLLMRLLLLPFDPINYLAGFVGVGWRSFTLATVLGVLPTAFAFVSFGAAIDMQALAAGSMPRLDIQMVAFAVIILIICLLASRYYARRALR